MTRITIARLTIGLCGASATVLAEKSGRYSGGKRPQGTACSAGRYSSNEEVFNKATTDIGLLC